MPASNCSRPARRSSASAATWVPTWPRSQLVLAGSRSVLAHSDGEVVDLLAGGQGVFNILPLSGVVSELEAAIVEIRGTATPRPGRDRSSGGGLPGRGRGRRALTADARDRVESASHR